MSTAHSQVLAHRYNFNTPDDGYTIADLVGSANGMFTGTGSFDGNGGLNLAGADGYVDLGPNVITGYTNLTIEAWVDLGANSSWTRLFDIGDTDAITGKGCYGMDFMVINGSSAGMFEVFDTDPGYDHAPSLSFAPSLNNHGKTHVVLSYDPQAPITSIYVDGALTASSTNINIPLSALNNAHTYIGRSGYNGDPYLNGTVDEFRIYEGVMPAFRVAMNAASGPNTIVSDSGAFTNINLTIPSPIYVEQTGIKATVTGDYENIKGVNLAFGNPTLTSSSSDVLALGSDGLFQAKGAGTATIIASYGGLSATQTVTVISFPSKLTHRYKFDETAGATTFADSVGTANGTVIGAANLDGGHLVLPGGGTEDYADLPPNILDGYDAVTFEFWVKVGTNPTWGRLVDFGNSSDSGSGINYISFTPHSGFSPAGANFEVNGNAGTEYMNTAPILDGLNLHLTLIFNPLNQSLSVYTNGALMNRRTGVTTPMSQIVNNHSWLGKSSYLNDNCGVDTIDEFRIYNGALSAFRVALNAASGPNNFIDDPGTLTNLNLSVSASVNIDQDFTATVTGDYTGVQGLNLAFANPTLQSGNTNIVVVTSGLNLSAVGSGTTTVTVSYGGLIKTQTVTVVEPASVLAHRYSFNETAGSTTFADSVGTANGTVIGTANLDGGNLILPGGGTEDYADLPGHLIDGYDALTFELWVTVGTNPTWGRLVDFGDTSDSGSGQYCIDFTPHSGFSPAGANFEVNGASGTESLNVAPILDGQSLHLTLVFDPNAHYLAIYTNAVLMGKKSNLTTTIPQLTNTHSWLGRSSYIADNCGADTIDEFRIYNGALSRRKIAADYAAGPNALPVVEEAPQMTIQKTSSNVIITWPSASMGYALQTSASFGASASWGTVPAAEVVTNGTHQITLPIGTQAQFYRLVK